MSREVRRVPVGWQHPTKPNPYWFEQHLRRLHRGDPEPKLHAREERFVGLRGKSISEAIEEWRSGREAWAAGTHEDFAWLLEYHDEQGYVDREGIRSDPIPYRIYADDCETVVREFFPKTALEIAEAHPWEEYRGSEPSPDGYMPDFDEPEDELGWCLYETVSEGTPVTPVFATAEELIDHLATVGQDWDQVPMRRRSAELLVGTGFTAGSFMQFGDGRQLRTDKDLDIIEDMAAK